MNRFNHSINALLVRYASATTTTFSIKQHYFRASGPLHLINSVVKVVKLTRQQRTSWSKSTGRMGEVHVPASRFTYFAAHLFALRAQRGILLCEAIGYRRDAACDA